MFGSTYAYTPIPTATSSSSSSSSSGGGWFSNIIDGLTTAAGSWGELLIAKEYAQTQAQIDALNRQSTNNQAAADAEIARLQAEANKAANSGWKPWMTYTVAGVAVVLAAGVAYKMVRG